MKKDKTAIDYVFHSTGKRFKANPRDNVVESYAVVWTDKGGKLPKPFPGKYLVIIGLEYVDRNNGLPYLEEKKALNHGEFVLVSGDDDFMFDNQGGGISLLVVLDM